MRFDFSTIFDKTIEQLDYDDYQYLPRELFDFLNEYDIGTKKTGKGLLYVKSKYIDFSIPVYDFYTLSDLQSIYGHRLINSNDVIYIENNLLQINTIKTLYIGVGGLNYGKVYYYDFEVVLHEISNSFNGFLDQCFLK